MPAQKRSTRKINTKAKSSIAQKLGTRRLQIYLVFAAFLVVGVSLLRSSSAAVNTVPARNAIIQTALAERGVLDNSARMRQYTGRSDQPEWCAYFVSWVLKTSGYPLRSGSNWRVPAVFRGSDSLKEVFIRMGTYQEYGVGKQTPLPRPGDVLIFKRSHTGFFTSFGPNGEMRTIEGNSSAAGKPNRVNEVSYEGLRKAGIMGWGNIDPLIERGYAQPSK